MNSISEAAKILNEVNADKTIEEIKKDPDKFFNNLRKKNKSELKKFGCCAWDDPDKDGNVLMLFPASWYSLIPKGYEVVDISDETHKFSSGVDKDQRFGCLAFGIKVKK